MAKKTVTNIKTDGGPAFMGKVDNRGGQISGRSDKNLSKKIGEKGKSKEEHRIQIIVAIIGAIAVIIAAIIRAISSI